MNVAEVSFGPFGDPDPRTLTAIVGLAGEIAGFEIDVSILEPQAEMVTDIRVTRQEGRMQVGLSVSLNSGELTPSDTLEVASSVAGIEYERAGAPNPLYSVDVGWTF